MSACTLRSITEALLSSYEEEGGINHVGALELPSRSAVEQVLIDLESLVFPGFTREERLTRENLPYITGTKLATLAEHIREQWRKNLRWERHARDEDAEAAAHVEEEATALTMEFLCFLPELRNLLSLDVNALLEGDPAARAREEVIVSYPGVRAILAHRAAHWFWRHDAKLIARMMSEDAHARTGIDIHPGARIGRSFHIDHGTGVVIGETTEIGDHVKIYQGVSLGALSVSRRLQDKKRHPTIGDHCTVYAGATILGGDTVVGHHSVIGGNVWLVRSVPPHSVVESDTRVRVRNRAGTVGDDWYEI
ncbi:MAG: serine O-acetyltransferase EpsC [Myxococcota bacterium]